MANDITFEHPKYIKHRAQVSLVQDFYGGIDTARQHLVKHSQENDLDFFNRYDTAILHNFVERIVTTQAGHIFRKAMSYEDVPENMIEFLDDMHIAEFTKEVVEYANRDGKAYILVDMSTDGGEPYLSHIGRTQLINWRKKDTGEFTMAVIMETYEVDDGFSLEYKTQYRHIKENGDVDIWRETTAGYFEIVESIITTYNFMPLYELDLGDIPPLYDIATVNKNHFNAFSDKDTIVSKATRPSFFTKGLGLEGGEDLKLGVNYSINTDNVDATVEWIELKGESIPQAQDDLERKEKLMAVRALQSQEETQKTKTATQSLQENSESTSRLSDIAEDCENAINQAYGALYMMKLSQEAVGQIVLNKDFREDAVDSNILLGLSTLVTAGNLSKETMLKALIKHEIVEIEDIDAELAQIDLEYVEPVDVTNETNDTTQ